MSSNHIAADIMFTVHYKALKTHVLRG